MAGVDEPPDTPPAWVGWRDIAMALGASAGIWAMRCASCPAGL